MTNVTNVYGAFDVQFDYIPNDDVTIVLTTNILGIQQFVLLDDSAYDIVKVTIGSKTIGDMFYLICSTYIGATLIDRAAIPIVDSYSPQLEHCRIYIHNADISVYFGGKWVYSNILGYVKYVTDLVVAAFSVLGDSMDLVDIKVTELHDYRDAVYVDYEATTDSAIQSVIQERPIQIFAEPERLLSFTYQCVKGILAAHHVKTFGKGIVANSSISSDGLIYYTNVSINTSALSAEEVGFITRLYRLSNLETGALRATKILQKLALERRYPLNIVMRFDPRLVIADELIIGPQGETGGIEDAPLYVTGTGTQIHTYCIIEDIALQFQDGQYNFSVRGRTLKADE